MYEALIVIHVIVAASLIGLVLIQHGKGADAGAAFGSGSSSTVFGARGSASFLTRFTAMLAAGFFVTSLVLGYLTLELNKGQDSDIVAPADTVTPTPTSEIPDVPPTPAAVTPESSDIPSVPSVNPESVQDNAVPGVNEATPAPGTDVNKIPE